MEALGSRNTIIVETMAVDMHMVQEKPELKQIIPREQTKK